MNLYESIKKNLKESVKVGPIYRLGMEEIITSYNDIRLDEIGITLEDIELFKRVDTSESAPDKVNYLLVADMHYDMDPSVSVPVVYNIIDDDYEQEINPSMFNHVDEELDSDIYNAVDEVIRNLALKISHSGRMNESEDDALWGYEPKVYQPKVSNWVSERSKKDNWKVKILEVFPTDEPDNTIADVELLDSKGKSYGVEQCHIGRLKVKIGKVYKAYIDNAMDMPVIENYKKEFTQEELPNGKQIDLSLYK